ncbi:MAG: efflux RND transporter permease subunit, partial [Negativicutes bacterium]|nr:efflux RND transporter permease subunit [Negativicutes bacterium]
MSRQKLGTAGRLAAAFINARLTPVLMVIALAAGLFAIAVTPREEEPQIIVPMVDIFVTMPGADPAEVEKQVTEPMEKLLAEISGVEYIYSQAMPGQNLSIVRFRVGENAEASLTKLYTRLMASYDRIPPGVSQPMIKLRSIDDVPVLALTLWSQGGRWTSDDLRRQAVEIAEIIKRDPDVAEVRITGGQPREFRVDIDPARLSAHNLTLDQLRQALAAGNQRLQAAAPIDGRDWAVQAGNFISTAADAGQLVV